MYEVFFLEYTLNIGHASKKIKKQAEPFYKKFMELIKTMQSSWRSYDLDRARSVLTDMHFEAMILGAMYNAATNGGTMDPQTPHASKARSNAVGKRPSVAQTAAEMAQFKVSIYLINSQKSFKMIVVFFWKNFNFIHFK